MATQNQGNANAVYSTLRYDHPTYITRQSASLGTITGSGGSSTTKFTAFTQLVVFGVTFIPVTALGSSTYTVNGTATTSCQSAYAVFVANTNTTGTAVTLATTTVGAASTGPFYIAGTGGMGQNVNVQGVGGLYGYSKYAINTLGGTNTTMPWGTTTYSSSPAGGGAAGQGGLYMNPGDVFYVVAGTDATGTASHILEYSVAPVIGNVVA